MLGDCTILVAKTKALISLKLRVFVFAYANSRVSHDAAQFMKRLTDSQETNRARDFFKSYHKCDTLRSV